MVDIVHSENINSNWVLSAQESAHFDKLKERSAENGKPMVLWGWKRDKVVEGTRYPESRTVYFSADLAQKGGEVFIERAYFFLETRAKRQEIDYLKEQVSGVCQDPSTEVTLWPDIDYPGYPRMRINIGNPSDYDRLTVYRRRKGSPRLSVAEPILVNETDSYNISKLAPFALCVGSGLSSESGLPLLGALHNLFEVDNPATRDLVFGAEDNLPGRVVRNTDQEFKNFCQFTIDAVKAKPSVSHEMLANMYKNGIIEQIFTDNMDDILGKVDVPYISTRTSIFPDKYPVEFNPDAKSLLVVGVAVDRRSVIKQARRAGLNIIAINPVYGVAPHSRNMDYLKQGDIFFREKAGEALPKIIEASRF